MNCLEKINDYTYVIEDKIKSILHMIWDELMSMLYDTIVWFFIIMRCIIVFTCSVFAIVAIYAFLRFSYFIIVH